MHTTHEQVGIEQLTSADLAALETWAPSQVKLTSSMTARLWLQTRLRLTQAQKELHDAIFALDGTDASLDRFASARAELDSAEAWALHVAKARYKRDQG
ncbi:FruA-associating protein, FapA [Pyxidicoccus xibeiensis]|uniref:FruA-associating protein, FapA n=1 Tax=Pyxidicoccus xibeiensis TaxID=2906759 RepID=UPI0020A75F87|nr:FruA-associating protein, FapA [Pyxidicoccus xibeiensis]MCP3137823.1 FruA-associating protein, FapA [Pyxidicoccus xibeiensis]